MATKKKDPAPADAAVDVADPTLVEDCVDFGAVLASAGTLRFYQVKGLCGMIEGP